MTMPRFGPRLRSIARSLLLLVALGLVGLSVMPLSGSDAWWARYPTYPAVEIGLAMLVVAPLVMLWRGWLGWIAIVGLLAGIAIQADRLAPYLAPAISGRPSPIVPGGSCAVQDRVRVIEVDLERTTRHNHALLDVIKAANPDVVWFQEVDAWWQGQLSALERTMPYEVARAQEGAVGAHLYSKLPLNDTSVQGPISSGSSVIATATLASGRRLRLYAIHPRPPLIGRSTVERDGQLAATALAAHDDRVAHVVLGALNTVPWAAEVTRLKEIGRVEDPRVGRGLFVTGKMGRSPVRWPLDYIMPGPGIVLSRFSVLPPFGSGRLPLLADLCVTGSPGVPRALDPASRAAAEASVARGQAAAVGKAATQP